MEIIKEIENENIFESKNSLINKVNENLKTEFNKSLKSNTNFDSSENQDSNIKFEFIALLDQKYGLIKKIGEGSSGKVFLGYTLNNNKIEKKFYSIKIFKSDKFNLQMFNSEINLLESINHENVLHISEYGKGNKIKLNGKTKEVYYIVMEYMEHGDLLKYITNISSKSGENIGFGEHYGRLIFSKLLDGLEAIHNSDTVHRDIKPENIMIGKDYKFKFVDLGFATKKSNAFLNKYMGTPAYAPPEIHLRKPYLGEYSDIFSLGITLFVLVTGSLPFRLSVPNDALYQFFVRNDYIGFWRQRRVKVSVSFMQLFDNMVAFDYTQRPSISEIRKSKWMQETDFSLEPKLIQELMRREAILNEKIKKEINEEESNNNTIFGFKRAKRDEEIYDCQKFMNENKNGEKNIGNNINMKNDNQREIINNNVNKEMIIEKENKEEVKIASLDSMKSINNEVIKDNKIDNDIKLGICIIVHNHNLNNIMTEICRYLKTKGFNYITKNPNELNIIVSNEHIEAILYFHKFKNDMIKITYNKTRGTNKDLEQIKKMIKNIKFKT